MPLSKVAQNECKLYVCFRLLNYRILKLEIILFLMLLYMYYNIFLQYSPYFSIS